MKKQNQPAQYHLTEEQILKMVAVSPPRDAALIVLMGFCGLRRNEARTLRPDAINWELKRLRITGKGNKFRDVPFSDFVGSVLTKYLRTVPITLQTNFVSRYSIFPSRFSSKDPMNNNWVNEIIKQAGRRAGLQNPDPFKKYINPHLLRHSYAHNLKIKNIPLEVIRDLMGHASILTTADQYGRYSINEIEKLLKKS